MVKEHIRVIEITRSMTRTIRIRICTTVTIISIFLNRIFFTFSQKHYSHKTNSVIVPCGIELRPTQKFKVLTKYRSRCEGINQSRIHQIKSSIPVENMPIVSHECLREEVKKNVTMGNYDEVCTYFFLK